MSTPDTTDSPAVVVAGVDGSPNSRAALAWAAEEATHRGCELRVITAWTLPTPRSAGATGPPSGLPDVAAHQEQSRHLVEEMVAAVLGEPHSTVCEAVRGQPLDVLREAGRRARMLVVGARGGGGRTGLRLGSVAEQLAHHAPCPVLVVPAERQRRPDGGPARSG